MSSLNLVSWEQNKPKKLLQIKEVSRISRLIEFKKENVQRHVSFENAKMTYCSLL